MKKLVSMMMIKLLLVTLLLISGCHNHIKPLSIYVSVLTNPSAAEVYYYVSSNLGDVKKSKRKYLGTSPYRRAMLLDIDGLSHSNAHQVVLTFEIVKKGYYKKIEKIDFRQILGIREVRLKYQLTESKGTEKEEATAFTVPLAPDTVSASKGEYKDYVEISWSKVEDAQKYYIYRDSKSDGDFKEKIALVKGLKYHDHSAKGGKIYYYKVQSYNKIGTSDLSVAAKGFREKSEDDDDDNNEENGKSGTPSGELGIPGAKTGGGTGVPGGMPFSPKSGEGAKNIFKNISG